MLAISTEWISSKNLLRFIYFYWILFSFTIKTLFSNDICILDQSPEKKCIISMSHPWYDIPVTVKIERLWYYLKFTNISALEYVQSYKKVWFYSLLFNWFFPKFTGTASCNLISSNGFLSEVYSYSIKCSMMRYCTSKFHDKKVFFQFFSNVAVLRYILPKLR